MSDIFFNVAKGRWVELVRRVATNDPADAALVVMLLKDTAEADAVLRDYDTFAEILAGSNTEANFSGVGNYSRIVYTDSDLSSPAPDDSNDRQTADIPDPTWANAGGTVENDLVKLIVGYTPDIVGGDDSDIIPLIACDFVQTTNGGQLTGTVPATGFARAT